MFIEIHHKIGNQNRISLVNTDKIISFDPCYELKWDKDNLFMHIGIDELKKLPDNPLITDYPDIAVKIIKYCVECENSNSYEISIEEYERIKNILVEVKL